MPFPFSIFVHKVRDMLVVTQLSVAASFWLQSQNMFYVNTQKDLTNYCILLSCKFDWQTLYVQVANGSAQNCIVTICIEKKQMKNIKIIYPRIS